jgi:gliding motility-associated-like protein
VYFSSPQQDAKWISFKSTGIHSVDKDYFYKTTINLPCSTLCGKSFASEGAYCLQLDLYADNSVYEIYVNGVPQSPYLGNVLPLSDPYRPVGFTPSNKVSVSLCHNWKEGSNSLVIQVASSPPVSGLLVLASPVQPPPVTTEISAAICEGDAYLFGGQSLQTPGTYLHTFSTAGCDSTVRLKLGVIPQAHSTIDTAICEGQSVFGYDQTGIYVDRFLSAQGCDSLRSLHLTVQNRPRLTLAAETPFCRGDSVTLYPGVFDSYLWQDLTVADHYVIKAPALITLQVSNQCGTESDETVAVEKECGVYFPTAFTPNDDGKNDLFKMLTEFSFETFSLRIYNRWGEKVFESTDSKQGWNGQYKGRPQPVGVFVWYCSYRRAATNSAGKGSFVLLR